MKRLLSCMPSEITHMKGEELKQSILASEGRIVMAETVVVAGPLVDGLTNAEVAAAFGSDMVLLNAFDCFNPHINGLPETDEPIKLLAELTGRPIGVNLEPVDETVEMMETRHVITKGRQASVETLKKAEELGFSFICLTGNPGVGVTNSSICNTLKAARENFSGLIIAGKMHAAGVDEPIVDLDAIEKMIDAGADVILMPACGTVPGLSEETVTKACALIKTKGALSLTAIGTSQEGSDEDTIREFALSSKRSGADIQHIGDAGWGGMALPENIMTLSIAIRGVRHTYFKMAQSVRR